MNPARPTEANDASAAVTPCKGARPDEVIARGKPGKPFPQKAKRSSLAGVAPQMPLNIMDVETLRALNKPVKNKIEVTTAMIGFGPANLGLLIAAIRRGEITDMTRNGLVIVEASETFGSGSIPQYHITANSLSEVFIECLEDPRLGTLFTDAKNSEVVRHFRDYPKSAPELQDVAVILEAMAKAVLSRLVQDHDVTVLRSTTATGWSRVGDRHLFNLACPSSTVLLDAKWAFVNCGGRNRKLRLYNAKKIVTSHELLTMPEADLAAAIEANTAARVCIVGGSHSAISCAQRLTRVGLKGSIDIHGRTPLRLFYPSREDAHRDGYVFDAPQDVCPLSGRINRFGGLRYDAHTAARKIISFGRISGDGPAIRIVTSAEPVKLVNASQRFDLMIVATGYEAAGPCGPTLHSERDGRVRSENGDVIPGLYSFGLGSGLIPSRQIGGEPSFNGRLDGVWLYQNDVGDEVLNAFSSDISEFQ